MYKQMSFNALKENAAQLPLSERRPHKPRLDGGVQLLRGAETTEQTKKDEGVKGCGQPIAGYGEDSAIQQIKSHSDSIGPEVPFVGEYAKRHEDARDEDI